ncbi:CEF3, partial [Symbiodinium pilosum]
TASTSKSDEDLVCCIPNLILMYGGSVKPLLSNTLFELRRGRRYGIVGQNGAGKTTLMSRVAVGDLPGMEKLKCYHLEHEGILDNIDRKTTCSQFVKLSLGCKTPRNARALPAVPQTSICTMLASMRTCSAAGCIARWQFSLCHAG